MSQLDKPSGSEPGAISPLTASEAGDHVRRPSAGVRAPTHSWPDRHQDDPLPVVKSRLLMNVW